MMNQNKKYIVFFCIFLLSILFAVNIYERYNSNEQVVSGAKIAASNLNLGIYNDSGCTKPVLLSIGET